jgi:ubiquinone/menaquinone biosynthesis C-methylase UbiE
MKTTTPTLLLAVLILLLTSCAPKPLPYESGPVMDRKSVQKTFQPILDFMGYHPGMAFADVGAGSGALTVMMASLMDRSTVYIQDIDSTVLKKVQVDKMIDYYSKQSNQDLRAKNKFMIAIGSTQKTHLPDQSCDLIYSNATVHVFTSLDSMMTDLGRKLKPGGVLFLRDSFKNDHKEGSFCSDPKCGRPLLTINEFLATMKKNGFTLQKQSPDMSGYPVFGFTYTGNKGS